MDENNHNNTITGDACSTTTTTTTTTLTTTSSTSTNTTPTVSASATTVSDSQVSPTLMSECYYHGLLPREDVQYLLKQNGEFLVRVSQTTGNNDRQIIISLLVDSDSDLSIGMRHVIVHRMNGKYSVELGGPTFDTLLQLIDFYRVNSRPLIPSIESSIMVTPVSRQKWELRHCDIKLSKVLGHGAYGEVFKGKMKRKSRYIDVAIKLAKSANLTKDKVKDIMREARMMRNYAHTNVVRIHGVALDDDPLMIVMELVRGGSLEDYLRKNSGNYDDIERLNNMASGAAWGIDYLHSHSCIHRDIAARNCLYDKSKVVKISDFGLSRQGERYKMTVTQRVPIKWIAPETLTTFTFTPASDVFAYGVLLWEIYTDGAEPFEGKKTAEIKTLLLDGVRLEFPPTTPPPIRDMVTQRIFNGRPEDRYTMSEIVQRLEQISGVKQPTKRSATSMASASKDVTQKTVSLSRENPDECSVSVDSSKSVKRSKRKKSPRRRVNVNYQPQRSRSN